MDTQKALTRVKLIAPMLEYDVKTAIRSHAIMEANNDTIGKQLKGRPHPLADTYNSIQHALLLKLMMDIARIFDVSEGPKRPPKKQDKASIPVLAALLSDKDVQAALEQEAENWMPEPAILGIIGPSNPEILQGIETTLRDEGKSRGRRDCNQAIAAFLAAADKLSVNDSAEKGALKRVRDVRDKRLAHSLFDKEPDEEPIYADLYALLDLAKEAARYALLAVQGNNTEFDDYAKNARENADGYAERVLEALGKTELAKPIPQVSLSP